MSEITTSCLLVSFFTFIIAQYPDIYNRLQITLHTLLIHKTNIVAYYLNYRQ